MQSIRSHWLIILILALSAIGISACNVAERFRFEEISSLTINPDVALPLVFSSVTAAELFDALEADDEFVTVDNTGLVVLTYSDSLYSLSVEEYLSIPDQATPVLLPTASIPIVFFGGGSISQANVKTGLISAEVSVAVAGNYELTLNFEDATNQGAPLVITETFSQTNFSSTPTDVSGAIFSFPDGSFDFTYTLIDLATNQPVVPTSLTVFSNGFTFSYVQGKFTAFPIETGNDSILTNILDKFSGEEFEVENPSIRFRFNNSAGGPIRIELDPINAVNSREGISAQLENQQLQDGFLLEYPPLSAVGEFRETVLTLDQTNTNFDVLTNLFPDRLDFNWEVQVGQDANPDDYFLLDTSRIEIGIEVEVPLALRAKSLTYQDTVPLQNADWPEVNELQEAELKLITDNGLPLDLLSQIYFLDDDGATLDSLFTRGDALLSAAPVDGNGTVTGTTEQITLIPVSADRYSRIQQSTQIGYRLRLETANQGNDIVRFSDQTLLGIKLGVRALLSAELGG